MPPTASRHRALPTLPPCCAPRAHLPAPACSCTSHRWHIVSSEDLAWRRRPQAAPARRFVAAACSARLVWLRRPLSSSSSSPTLVCGLSLPTPGCLLPSSLCMLCMVAGPRQRLPSSTVAQRCVLARPGVFVPAPQLPETLGYAPACVCLLLPPPAHTLAHTGTHSKCAWCMWHCTWAGHDEGPPSSCGSATVT